VIENSVNDTITVSILINDTSVNGTLIRIPDKSFYQYGDTIKIIAIPQTGYEFVGWSGDTVSSSDTLSLILTDNLKITANFFKESQMPLDPDLTGTWGFYSGIYMSGGIYGTFVFNASEDTLVIRSDSTYTSYIKKSATLNGQNFGGIGSGSWHISEDTISFSHPLLKTFIYSISGNFLTLTNGVLTLEASRK